MKKKMTAAKLDRLFANNKSQDKTKTNNQNTNNNKKMGKIFKKTGM